jgi:hypothetical protein
VVAPKTCTAPKDRTFGKYFVERCGKIATVMTPFGPQCAECATILEKDTREGNNVIGMLLKQRNKGLD